MTPTTPVRASDAERELTAERLRLHGAEGRLDLGELEERLGRAFAAGTREELESLLGDLPRLGRSGRRGGRPAAIPAIATTAVVGFVLGMLGAGDWLLFSPFLLLGMIPAAGPSACVPGR